MVNSDGLRRRDGVQKRKAEGDKGKWKGKTRVMAERWNIHKTAEVMLQWGDLIAISRTSRCVLRYRFIERLDLD